MNSKFMGSAANYRTARLRWRNLLAGALAAGLFATPALGGGKKDKSAEPAAPKLSWPQPPQTARIVFQTQITGLDDVKGRPKQNWMDKVAGTKPKPPRSRLVRPYGVAADSKGRIFVADPAERTVYVFDLEQKKIEYRGDRAPAQLALPVGLAMDDQDRLFVADSFFHQITCFSPNGDVISVFGGEELVRPGGIALDTNRKRLYVADAKGGRVAAFDTDSFRFVRFIGEKGTPGEVEDGKFSAPTSVAVNPQGEVYVTDMWNYRVQVFDPEGKFVRAIGQQGTRPGTFRRPKGLAFDSDGHLYVADAEFNNFQIMTEDGKPLLAVGSYGSDPGQFAVIAGISIRNNRIYVTDQWRGRVQVFQYIPDQQAGVSGETSAGAKATVSAKQ